MEFFKPLWKKLKHIRTFPWTASAHIRWQKAYFLWIDNHNSSCLCPHHSESIIRLAKIGVIGNIWCRLSADLLMLARPPKTNLLMISGIDRGFIACWGQLAVDVVGCRWDNEPCRDKGGLLLELYVNEPRHSLNLPPQAVRGILKPCCAAFTWTVQLA